MGGGRPLSSFDELLSMAVLTASWWIRTIINLCHISGICPIEDVSEIVDGTLSKFLQVEDAVDYLDNGSLPLCRQAFLLMAADGIAV